MVENERIQRTLWNAQIFGETRRQQEATELLGRTKVEHHAKLQEYAAEHLALVREQLAAFTSAGIDLSQHIQIKNAADLTPEQKADLLLCPPALVAVANGEPHNAGEDSVGVYLVPWDVVRSAKLQQDMLSAVEFVSTGTPLVTALTVIQRAKSDIEAKQKALFVRVFKKIDKESEASPGDSSPAPQII